MFEAIGPVLVFAAHPDDEVLGCGGTIAKHAAFGADVYVVILAEGATARDPLRDALGRKDDLLHLRECAQKANMILGVKELFFEGLPDNRLDSVDRLSITKIIEKYIAKIAPKCVYTHHGGDVNIDHRRVCEAVVTACRSVPGHSVEQLLFFEVASSTEWQVSSFNRPFVPNWFVDISHFLEKKLQALNAYVIEMRDFPHPRSFRALEYQARFRGVNVGLEAAESFILGRCIIK